MEKMLTHLFVEEGLVAAFAMVGAVMWLSYVLSKRLTFGRVHGSAIAIVIGLALAYVGGRLTHGHKGLADLPVFAGIGLMGGGMLRDFAIVATAFEVDVGQAKKAGLLGVVALTLGTVIPFVFGSLVARATNCSATSTRPARPSANWSRRGAIRPPFRLPTPKP